MAMVHEQQSLTDPTALEVNRRGALTDRQRARLALREQSDVGRTIVVAAMFAVFGLFFVLAPTVAAMALQGLSLGDGLSLAMTSPAVAFALVFFGLAILFLVNFSLRRRSLREELTDPRVESGDGEVIVVGMNLVARVAGRNLDMGDTTASAPLAPGPHRFYYLPRSGMLLSAERHGGTAQR
jgi:hypothetical protein